MTKVKIARRDFLKTTIAASTAIPLGAIPIILEADDHRLSEDDPMAQRMGYKHDATAVDVSKYPGRSGEAGSQQFCDNCRLYQVGEDGWGGCAIFPGKQVAAKGWCAAWVSK